MKVLVTGANGLLGQHLVKLLLQNNYHVIATGKGACRLTLKDEGFRYYDVDLTNFLQVEQLMTREKADIIVHAAAMTQVDDCQQQQEECLSINVQATAQLLLIAEQLATHFIFISTDFIFDGEAGNYDEEAMPAPVSWYGFTKVQAEGTVETSEIPWAIIRTCLVYGNALSGTRSNILNWVKSSLQEGREIKVVDDQVRTPTFVEDLARGILLVIQKKATGIYHISGKDVLTPYQMAIATANYLGLNTELIRKVDASVFSQPARRPQKTGFNISKARRDLGFEPVSFEEGLRRTMNDER